MRQTTFCMRIGPSAGSSTVVIMSRASPDAASWLAAAPVVATGSDTTAYEQIKPGVGHDLLPVHRVLLVEAGIHIIELLNLEHAADAGLTEFVFVMAPLRIVGGTGSPVRPFAVVST